MPKLKSTKIPKLHNSEPYSEEQVFVDNVNLHNLNKLSTLSSDFTDEKTKSMFNSIMTMEHDAAAVKDMTLRPFISDKTGEVEIKQGELQFIINWFVSNHLGNNIDTFDVLKNTYGVEAPHAVVVNLQPFFISPSRTTVNPDLIDAIEKRPDTLSGFLVTNNVPHTSCFIVDKNIVLQQYTNLYKVMKHNPEQLKSFASKIVASYANIVDFTVSNNDKHKLYSHFENNDYIIDEYKKIKIDNNGNVYVNSTTGININSRPIEKIIINAMAYPVFEITVYNGGLGFLGADKNSLDSYKNRLTPKFLSNMLEKPKHSTSVIDAAIYSVDAAASYNKPTRISGVYTVTRHVLKKLQEFANKVTSVYGGNNNNKYNFQLDNTVKYCELISLIPPKLNSTANAKLQLVNGDVMSKINTIFETDVTTSQWNKMVNAIFEKRRISTLYNCMTWGQYIFDAYDLHPNCYHPKLCPGLDYLSLLSFELRKLDITPDYTTGLGGGKSTRKSSRKFSRKSNKKNKRRSNRRSTRKN